MTPRILKVSMEYENKTKLFQRAMTAVLLTWV